MDLSLSLFQTVSLLLGAWGELAATDPDARLWSGSGGLRTCKDHSDLPPPYLWLSPS